MGKRPLPLALILLLAGCLQGCPGARSGPADMSGLYAGQIYRGDPALLPALQHYRLKMQLEQTGTALKGRYRLFVPPSEGGWEGAVKGRREGDKVQLEFELPGQVNWPHMRVEGTARQPESVPVIAGTFANGVQPKVAVELTAEK